MCCETQQSRHYFVFVTICVLFIGDNHCSSSISEQNTSIAIFPINTPRQSIGSDHKCVLQLGVWAAQELSRRDGSKQKPTASCRQIKGHCVCGASNLGSNCCGVSKHIFGAGGRADDNIDIFGRNSSHLECLLAGFDTKTSKGFALGQDASLRDSGTCADPLIVCFDYRLEVGVCDNCLGGCMAYSDGTTGKCSRLNHGQLAARFDDSLCCGSKGHGSMGSCQQKEGVCCDR
mmetsp:Transcript_6122/g.12623  ORF Transcript_6122/g.12623 Transcript_6122/m.12623 type:complete len:232 (-) Transcript_6122:151-846(-)